MTQIEARNAVNRIKLRMMQLIVEMSDNDLDTQADEILTEIITLEQSLSIRHFIPAPNCRPATAAELQQLAAASNVVIFHPAA